MRARYPNAKHGGPCCSNDLAKFLHIRNSSKTSETPSSWSILPEPKDAPTTCPKTNQVPHADHSFNRVSHDSPMPMYKFTSSKPKWRTDSSNFLHFHVMRKKQEGDTKFHVTTCSRCRENGPILDTHRSNWERSKMSHQSFTRSHDLHMRLSKVTRIQCCNPDCDWTSMCHRGGAQSFLGGNASIFHGCSCNLQTRLTICIPVWEPVLDWYHLCALPLVCVCVKNEDFSFLIYWYK